MHILVLRVNAGPFFPQLPMSARTSHKCFTLYKRSTRRFLIFVGSLGVVECTCYFGNLPGLTNTKIYIQRITIEESSTHILTHDFMGRLVPVKLSVNTIVKKVILKSRCLWRFPYEIEDRGSEAVFRNPLRPKIALVYSTCVAFAGYTCNYDRFSPRRRYMGNLFLHDREAGGSSVQPSIFTFFRLSPKQFHPNPFKWRSRFCDVLLFQCLPLNFYIPGSTCPSIPAKGQVQYTSRIKMHFLHN